MLYVPTGVSPYVFHFLYVLHCICTSLSSVIASKHYMYFVLPYASYHVLCILVCLPWVLHGETSYIRLVMHCVLSCVCHMPVRPFGFIQM